ncbi:MAG: class I SAM-dependent methyltransferase [Syntrophaceae bacterium]
MPFRTDYTDVTELSGDEVTQEQIDRTYQRYYWASEFCRDKDVVELACGTGQGLGFISTLAKSLIAGDISAPMVAKACAHYGERIDIRLMDALDTRLPDASCDVVILFEAIYYLPDIERFMKECRRILRNGGYLLIASANKNLYDFNPSPYSVNYYGVSELSDVLEHRGFSCTFWGGTPVDSVALRQRLLRPLKAFAVRFNLMPGTMATKKFIKRFIFGRLVPMPAEIAVGFKGVIPPRAISCAVADTTHKVIYCAAQKYQ